MVAETFGKGEMRRVSGDGVEVGEGLVDTAVLLVQHLLKRLVADLRGEFPYPVRHFQHDLERLLVACEVVGIDESGIDLVQSIPWDGQASQILGSRFETGHDAQPRFGKRREKPRGLRGLHLRHDCNGLVKVRFETLVAGAAVHLGASG